jgi:hypothetical protein
MGHGWEKWYEGDETDPGSPTFEGLLGCLFLPVILVIELIFAFILVITPPLYFLGRWVIESYKKIKEKSKEDNHEPM